MKARIFAGTFRHAKLLDELAAVAPRDQISLSTEPLDNEPCARVGYPDQTADNVIAAVIAAHDPNTPSVAEAADLLTATNDQTIRDRLVTALANLEAANTNWGTLTAAQKDAALRATVRSVAGLIRLLLRRLEATG